ncbi:MAG: strictosidine synthase family protein [bacterium]
MKILIVVLIVLLLVIAGFILDLMKDAGEFKKLEPHSAGKCEKVSGVIGAEDITVHPETGVAFISCDDRRATFKREPTQGVIYAYDFDSENPELINLTKDFEKEFHPHGISLFIGDEGEQSLFVVNHTKDGQFIEVFDIQGDSVIHRESIQGELMHSPNDVVAVGPRQFYATNDHGSVSRFGRILEEYLRLAKSNVVYYDGSEFRIVAEKISYANGINVSHDGRTVYVASTTGGKINVYDMDVSTGALELKNRIELGTGVDNIELDGAGSLWVAAHPKLLTFVKHSKDPAKISPSQILKIIPQAEDDYKIEEIYLDEGEAISGSSVGAVFEQKLLIGSVFDHHFLVCEVEN